MPTHESRGRTDCHPVVAAERETVVVVRDSRLRLAFQHRVAPPEVDASLHEVADYVRRARRAGWAVGASDMVAYQDRLRKGGKEGLFTARDLGFIKGDASLMVGALEHQNPGLYREYFFMRQESLDKRDAEYLEQQRASEIDRATASESFDRNMARLADARPLSLKPSVQEYLQYDRLTRSLGVHVSASDLKRYAELARDARPDALAPANLRQESIGVRLLVEQWRAKEKRELIGTGMLQFKRVLQASRTKQTTSLFRIRRIES
jgi:hypothetical protein